MPFKFWFVTFSFQRAQEFRVFGLVKKWVERSMKEFSFSLLLYVLFSLSALHLIVIGVFFFFLFWFVDVLFFYFSLKDMEK
jgi:hypothetical protein